MKMTLNFNLSEFYCKDGTPVPPVYISNVQELARNLQVLRDHVGAPIHINSAYRHPEYNRRIGGVPNSQHLTASAADITTKNLSPRQLKNLIEKLIKEGKMHNGGIGLYPGFVHYDIRKKPQRWNK